jgi:hypothetical protein
MLSGEVNIQAVCQGRQRRWRGYLDVFMSKIRETLGQGRGVKITFCQVFLQGVKSGGVGGGLGTTSLTSGKPAPTMDVEKY